MFSIQREQIRQYLVFKVDKMFSTATTVTTWDMYDTLCSAEQNETMHNLEQKADYLQAVVDISRSAEMSTSVGSTVSSGNSQRSWRGSSHSFIQNVLLSSYIYHLIFLFSQCF